MSFFLRKPIPPKPAKNKAGVLSNYPRYAGGTFAVRSSLARLLPGNPLRKAGQGGFGTYAGKGRAR
jgi:hypothetical protein